MTEAIELDLIADEVVLQVLGEIGPRGPQGDKGDQGDVGTVDAGTTTTGDPGTDALVVSVTTPTGTVLHFTIPRGDPGPAGPAGPQGTYYRHTQNTPDVVWVIQHDLGYRPSVTTTDTSGTRVFGDVAYIDENIVEARFDFPFGGYAECS